MAKPFRPKRGTTAKNDSFVGLAHEVTLDTERNSLRIHDGVTAGGVAELAPVFSKNYGKSIGVFGGSISVQTASQAAKNIWRKALKCSITDYGVGGAGFSSLQGDSIQNQVQRAGKHDIYILWCSTNDFTNSREVGLYSDYTYIDGYDESKLKTQCGGINFCIKYLTDNFPDAEIYLFTSTRMFTNESGYNTLSAARNNAGYSFDDYLNGQIQCCGLYGIPFLNQFDGMGISILNNTRYSSDGIHFNEAAYKKLGYAQAAFLMNGGL